MMGMTRVPRVTQGEHREHSPGRAVGRRRFLAGAAGFAAAGLLTRCATLPRTAPRGQRIVLVRFGGGVRYQDLFGDHKDCLAPYLRHLSASGTLYTGLRNSHLTRHDTATQYLLTARYGSRLTSNAEGSRNLEELGQSPTIFERYRKSHGRPVTKVLAAGVPDHSKAESHGEAFRAATFASENTATSPPISGDASLGHSAHVAMGNERLLRVLGSIPPGDTPRAPEARRRHLLAAVRADLQEVPLDVPELGSSVAAALTGRLMAERPFIAADEADDWLMALTFEALPRLRPDLVMIGFSTPDLAHRGAWRSYQSAVRHIDTQLYRLSRFLSENPYYRDRTTLMVTTDCGRGAVHFDEHLEPLDEPSHRQSFLLATGVGQRPLVITEQREQVDVPASIAAMLEFDLEQAEGIPLLEAVS